MSAKQCGFTIIEMILTLVLIGALVSMIVPLFASGIYTANVPIERVRSGASLQQVLENMIADYRENYWDSNSTYLESFYTKLGQAENSTGYGDYNMETSNLDKYVISDWESNYGQGFVNSTIPENSLLHVTISNDEGHDLTFWFMRQNRGASNP